MIPDGWRRVSRASEVEVGKYYGVFGVMVSGTAKDIPLPVQIMYVEKKVDGWRPYLTGNVYCYLGKGFGRREFRDQVLFLDQVGIGSKVRGEILKVSQHDIGLYAPPDDINKMVKSITGKGYEDVIVENTGRVT